MSKNSKNEMDSFQAWCHRWGRVGTVIALAYFVNNAALFESCAAFLPAIVPCLPMETHLEYFLYIFL